MSLSNWVHEEICELLGPETPRAYSQYVLEIKDPADVKEYLTQIASEDTNAAQIVEFVDLLTAKRSAVQGNVTVYKKKDEFSGGSQSVRSKKKKDQKKTLTLDDLDSGPDVKTPIDTVKQVSPKKKTNYVSLYGKGGEDRMQAVRLPGRHPCECQAQKHKLINNCLGCGRVVCQQEGSGPCLFCGKLVCTPEEKKILAKESNKSEKLLKKLSTIEGGGSLANDEAESKGLKTAQEYKNRLLEYDRTYVQRTKVIDDESDFYSAENVWLSSKEREVMQKREKEMREIRFGSRLNRKVTLDFAGRRVIDEDQMPSDLPPIEILSLEEEKPSVNPTIQDIFPELTMPKLVGKENKNPVKKASKGEDSNLRKSKNRLQDKELQKMSDSGMCLSMHQPWASLLVRGIKKHEGRIWYSNHRGRLWIAAASHKPSAEEIQTIEQQHLQFNEGNVEFPTEYPTSCLLGCVNVEDVSSQEEYRKQFPDGESGSPYVFVCSNFEELLIKLPLTGKHKIWKLPSDVHQAARKARTICHDQLV